MAPSTLALNLMGPGKRLVVANAVLAPLAAHVAHSDNSKSKKTRALSLIFPLKKINFKKEKDFKMESCPAHVSKHFR